MALRQSFSRTLAGLLPSDNSQKSKVKDSLREYARLATPILKAIPFAGEAASEISDRMLDYFTKDKSWQSKFEELAKELGTPSLPAPNSGAETLPSDAAAT
jgi:hypothetical protein